MLTGDSISVGINFLAKGHLPMIKETMLSERHTRTNDKFPHLPEMIALLLKESLTRGTTHLSCPNILNLYKSVTPMYEEESVREVCCFFSKLLNIKFFHIKN